MSVIDKSKRDHAAIASVLGALPWLGGIRADAMAELVAGSEARSFAAGDTLFAAGTPARGLFVIVEGTVRIVRSGARRQFVVHTEGPGGTLGEVPLFESGSYPATAIAAAATRSLIISGDAVWRAIAADPRIAAIFLRRLATRIRSFVERLDELAAQGITPRLAAIVLARHDDARGAAFSLGRTHTQIAEELGTVREVVVRTLRTFRAAGALRSAGRGHYAVADARALRRIAAGDG